MSGKYTPIDKQIESISFEKEQSCISLMYSYDCGMDQGNDWTYSDDHVRHTYPISSASS
jgi:hypothetical protein